MWFRAGLRINREISLGRDGNLHPCFWCCKGIQILLQKEKNALLLICFCQTFPEPYLSPCLFLFGRVYSPPMSTNFHLGSFAI